LGVTVQALKDKEVFHRGLTELHVLPTMHERKNFMIQLADGFVALPGGIGTFEEKTTSPYTHLRGFSENHSILCRPVLIQISG